MTDNPARKSNTRSKADRTNNDAEVDKRDKKTQVSDVVEPVLASAAHGDISPEQALEIDARDKLNQDPSLANDSFAPAVAPQPSKKIQLLAVAEAPSQGLASNASFQKPKVPVLNPIPQSAHSSSASTAKYLRAGMIVALLAMDSYATLTYVP